MLKTVSTLLKKFLLIMYLEIIERDGNLLLHFQAHTHSAAQALKTLVITVHGRILKTKEFSTMATSNHSY
jgi:hypothetical protein